MEVLLYIFSYLLLGFIALPIVNLAIPVKGEEALIVITWPLALFVTLVFSLVYGLSKLGKMYLDAINRILEKD